MLQNKIGWNQFISLTIHNSLSARRRSLLHICVLCLQFQINVMVYPCCTMVTNAMLFPNILTTFTKWDLLCQRSISGQFWKFTCRNFGSTPTFHNVSRKGFFTSDLLRKESWQISSKKNLLSAKETGREGEGGRREEEREGETLHSQRS